MPGQEGNEFIIPSPFSVLIQQYVVPPFVITKKFAGMLIPYRKVCSSTGSSIFISGDLHSANSHG